MPDREGQYDPEEASEETGKMRKLVDTSKASNYSEAEKVVEGERKEYELSPEVIEKIMEKVQDINEPETAVHALDIYGKKIEGVSVGRIQSLKKAFENGLLGVQKNPMNVSDWGEESKKRGKDVDENRVPSKEEWAKTVRSRKQKLVFFNIVGRDIQKVEDAFGIIGGSRNPVTIIFQTEPFTEEIKEIEYGKPDRFDGTYQVDYTRKKPGEYKSRHFGAYEVRHWYDPEGRPTPYADNGFALSFRVSPRWFQGVVFRVDRDATHDEVMHADEFSTTRIKKHIADVSKDVNEKRAQEISHAMLTSTRDISKLVPVYDVHGNMWWPKRMSYEEVKKFVEEREKAKDETETI